MAFSDFQSALSTLRTHLSNEAWDSARKQLLVCRSWIPELGRVQDEGLSVDLYVKQLDAIELQLAAQLTDNQNRFVMTRTNYASR